MNNEAIQAHNVYLNAIPSRPVEPPTLIVDMWVSTGWVNCEISVI